MSGNVFADLAAALAPYVGGSTDIAGFILGTALVFGVAIAMTWVVVAASKGSGDAANVFMFAAGFGVVIDVGIGWYPPWVIIFLGLLIAFLVIKPFGSGGGTVG